VSSAEWQDAAPLPFPCQAGLTDAAAPLRHQAPPPRRPRTLGCQVGVWPRAGGARPVARDVGRGLARRRPLLRRHCVDLRQLRLDCGVGRRGHRRRRRRLRSLRRRRRRRRGPPRARRLPRRDGRLGARRRRGARGGKRGGALRRGRGALAVRAPRSGVRVGLRRAQDVARLVLGGTGEGGVRAGQLATGRRGPGTTFTAAAACSGTPPRPPQRANPWCDAPLPSPPAPRPNTPGPLTMTCSDQQGSSGSFMLPRARVTPMVLPFLVSGGATQLALNPHSTDW
jgi:hypothetical protein